LMNIATDCDDTFLLLLGLPGRIISISRCNMGWNFILQQRQYNCELWTCISVDYNQKLVKALDGQGHEHFFSWDTWQKFPLLSV
jgi:hypothetical protein